MSEIKFTGSATEGDAHLEVDSEAEVISMLGQPDDVVSFEEEQRSRRRYGAALQPGERRLCYGTDGHLGLPTLGWVIVDVRLRARWVAGAIGSPPAEKLISETRLRELLRVIDASSDLPTDGRDWNSSQFIQIVNSLQPHGASRALAAIREYARVTAVRFGNGSRVRESRGILFPLLRVLFHSAHPRDPGFDVVVVDGIPFWIQKPLTFLGEPHQFLFTYADFYKTRGRFLAAPLRPSGPPFESLEKLQRTALWKRNASTPDLLFRLRRSVMVQLLRLFNGETAAKMMKIAAAARDNATLNDQWLRARKELNNWRWDALLGKFSNSAMRRIR